MFMDKSHRLTMIVDAGIKWKVVNHFDFYPFILLHFDKGSWILAVYKNHVAFKTIW